MNTHERILRAAVKTHGYKYDYSQTQPVAGHRKMEVACHKHGPFQIVARLHVSGRGCPKCERIAQQAADQRAAAKRREDIVALAAELFKHFRGRIALVPSSFVGKNRMATFYCREHGHFEKYLPQLNLPEVPCPGCCHES